ncbi:Flotillin-like protein 1 [Beauveria bassiana]|uniref:SPFH domain/Band 7 family protein n=1 Tax=Beauveria bassiana (strain ARSEF 2860) TaxID=655819 RepID=J5K2Y2_BEAB2|nr:SPFH domain/Band 7 family protein [Beauveria bassiana ARSEF 2860]EJP68446.1 SPFH domain/Band 7 family protein [Beauveria bassiana ARSEF 2860]KAH8710933.1 Flotillin-like protein 1 [Beauveria bassiana]
MTYRVSAPDEYLAITGMGIKNVRITKSAWVWPFQRCTRFSVQPQDYAMDLLAMTKEKLQFALPVVFTVGPDVDSRGANTNAAAAGDGDDQLAREDRGDALTKYAMLLSQSDDGKGDGDEKRRHLANIVKGIIEGETRVLVSSMTMEEIFSEREMFKRRIFRNIQAELDQFGLRIWNSNVKELKDAPGSNYFSSLSRKAHEGATNQARIDVAEAQLKGNVGESARHGQQEREIAKIHAETAVQKTERDIERAQAVARLATHKTALDRDVNIAKVTAERTLQSTDEDLKREVEIKRAGAELERLRATDLVKATIEKESKQQEADAAAYKVAADAKASQEAKQHDADAEAYRIRLDAEASSYATQQLAEADNFSKLKEAEGVAAMADAYAKMSTALGGPAGLLQYLMIEKGTYVELANANAEAIRGLEPKISVWNTGSAAGGSNGANDSAETMRNIYQMLPPLMTTINEQTGITLPEWQFGKMAAVQKAVQQE